MAKATTKTKTKDTDEDLEAEPSPKEVLFEQMSWYRTKAIKTGMLIAKYLKEEGGRGQELVALFKHLTALRKEIVDVATKLAPYEHAKLESIEVKAEIEHRYVVRAPITFATTQDFLKAVNKDDKPAIESGIRNGLQDISDSKGKSIGLPVSIPETAIDDDDIDEAEIDDFKEWEN